MPRKQPRKTVSVRISDPKHFARGSFKVESAGKGIRITVACPKGQWNSKTGRCEVKRIPQKVTVSKSLLGRKSKK